MNPRFTAGTEVVLFDIKTDEVVLRSKIDKVYKNGRFILEEHRPMASWQQKQQYSCNGETAGHYRSDCYMLTVEEAEKYGNL